MFGAKLRDKIEIMSALSEICICLSEFCDKFVVSVSKLQFSAPPTF